MKMSLSLRLLSAGLCSILASCSSADLANNFYTEDAKLADDGVVTSRLKRLPAPREPVVLAVYAFEDKTGQHKPSDDFPEYSRAVTQGGASLLNKALYDAGNGSWFRVLEREGLNNLVQERKIIRATRMEYAAPDGQELGDIGPLLYAGLLVEGAIVAYESDVVTGGAGARYLGVGGDTQYRRDLVTVALRAISVQTGEIILAVNTSKTIFSTALQGGVNKFVAIDELLEIESGFSLNEPPQFAVRQAIEMAVYSMIVEGAVQGLWQFADPIAGQRIIRDYLSRDKGVKDGEGLPPSPDWGPQSGQVPPVSYQPPSAPAPALMDRGALPAAPRVRESEPLKQPKSLPPTGNPTLKQLPKDAKAGDNAGAEVQPIPEEARSSDDNIMMPDEYQQQGVVYCGPSGCLPAYEAPGSN